MPLWSFAHQPVFTPTHSPGSIPAVYCTNGVDPISACQGSSVRSTHLSSNASNSEKPQRRVAPLNTEGRSLFVATTLSHHQPEYVCEPMQEHPRLRPRDGTLQSYCPISPNDWLCSDLTPLIFSLRNHNQIGRAALQKMKSDRLMSLLCR